jgi:type I restriction enzyme, S subunit
MSSRWPQVELGDVVKPRRQKASPASLGDVPFIGLEHVEAQTARILDIGRTSEMKSAVAVFQTGDVLYGRLRPYLNKVVRPDFAGAASAEFIVLPGNDRIDAGFLQHLLMQRSFVEFASHINQGDRPRVDFEQIGRFRFFLPSLVEQRCIVAKLENLLARSKKAREELTLVPRLVERYKQAILALAFKGEMTAEWRDENASLSAVPATAEIEAERKALFLGIDGNPDRYAAPDQIPSMTPFNIPDRWLWLRAEAVCDFITKGTTPASAAMTAGKGEVPYIKVYNLTFNASLDFEIDPTFISKKTHNKDLLRSIVYPGDVLMNIVGPPLGKVSLVPDTWPEWNINQAIAAFRPVPSLNRRFLAFWLLSDQVLRWAVARAKATAGQSNLTLQLCRDIPVPVCSVEEQDEIVRQIDSAFAAINQAAIESTRATGLLDRLDQATLVKAFRGELVPHDGVEQEHREEVAAE